MVTNGSPFVSFAVIRAIRFYFLRNMEGLFHVHSNYSADGRLSLEELREECIKRSLRFMVVTDHAEDFPPGKIRQFVDHCQKISDGNFLVVPGLEFNIDKDHEVHLLVVGLEDFVSADGKEEILKKIRKGETTALTVMAHLSRSNHYIPSEYENRINGIEVWNAAYDSRYLPDHKAIRLFAGLKKVNKRLIGFGGLDLHDHSGFRGLRICLLNSCVNATEVLDHLKEGRFIIRGPFVDISSSPNLGFFRIKLLEWGRKLLTVADCFQWQIVSWKKSFSIQKQEDRIQKTENRKEIPE